MVAHGGRVILNLMESLVDSLKVVGFASCDFFECMHCVNVVWDHVTNHRIIVS